MAFRSYIESIAFQPPTPAAYSERDPRLSWVPLRADGPDGPRIPVYFARAPGRSLTDASQAVTIVYSHGNAEDLGQLMPLMDELALALGVNVCAYDYVGYGPVRSTKPSESGNYRSVEAAVRWLETVRRIPISNIVLYGRSLGGGAAVHAAITFPKGVPAASSRAAAPTHAQFAGSCFNRLSPRRRAWSSTCPSLTGSSATSSSTRTSLGESLAPSALCTASATKSSTGTTQSGWRCCRSRSSSPCSWRTRGTTTSRRSTWTNWPRTCARSSSTSSNRHVDKDSPTPHTA
eukprot:Unigene11298_Nuclearia_a/m.34517 Unigene11298_Nuclearia_a/g.34517  ORF Unigene11298_Nuclearia_a/g.34517 Unigene11298_Nuclearia_a/m.34517 type:complete len:290 (+) Unigene11298_Nuclearia_a:14-883(+)